MKLALIRDQTQVKFYYQNNVITNQRNKLCAKYISVHWSTGEGFPTAVFAAGEGQVLFEQVLSVKSFLFFICLLICFSMMILAHPPWLLNASHLATGRYAHESFRLWVSCAHKSSRLRVSSPKRYKGTLMDDKRGYASIVKGIWVVRRTNFNKGNDGKTSFTVIDTHSLF